MGGEVGRDDELDAMPIGRLVGVAGHAVATYWQRLMAQHGLTTTGLAALDALETMGDLSHADLARRCWVTPATLTGAVDALEEHGWVTRRRDATNRRRVWVALTDEGRRHLGEVRETAMREQGPLFAHLAPADEPVVRRFLVETIRRFQDDDATD